MKNLSYKKKRFIQKQAVTSSIHDRVEDLKWIDANVRTMTQNHVEAQFCVIAFAWLYKRLETATVTQMTQRRKFSSSPYLGPYLEKSKVGGNSKKGGNLASLASPWPSHGLRSRIKG